MSTFKQVKKECPAVAPWVIQGSIYRAIHKEIIKANHMNIVCWFTDWKEASAKADPNYPQSPITPYKIPLLSEEATLASMREFIRELEKYENVPEAELPFCTPEELWQDEPTYKYYKDPLKKTRSTKNFTDFLEARTYFAQQGGVGELVTVQGKAMACNYCNVSSMCSQYKQLKEAGMIKE
ncbi:MAG: hypothetical protein ACRC9H_00505 [Aeromonas veronii]